ncbi:NAD-dependent epimerase/dehydratase family protein [Shewanella xiamenensis]|uniref:NAD-dependent epimerase/dehydratase family protein n=1 Tax=Shewanella xiamenensis TaxID=332186 RepID=UPI001C5026FF|nr:NAD(P)-dependent oxidoreductase [Shewanella xiamenensis]MBW0278030.1 hypothetical protein [Shewanella xiamenensis]MCT8872519.1 NAD(P)-dependent oxidoreductase [Shewanella xiamenensis]UWH43351.1 NAD(P)-dependent oxidoreductase [Shewanella xiamenensis]
MTKSMVITGASGFLGQTLRKSALLEGWQILCINRHAIDGALAFDDPRLESHLTMFAPKVIVHLAASYGEEAKGEGLQANLLLPLRLLKWASTQANIRFIAAGSFWQFGDIETPGPVDMYSASKQSLAVFLDYYRRCERLDCYHLILSSSYGPNDPRGKLVDYFVNAAKTKRSVNLGHQDKHFALTDVRDVASAIMLLSSYSAPLPLLTYRVRTEQLWTFERLGRLFEKLGYTLNVRYSPLNNGMMEIIHPNDEHIPTLPHWSESYCLEDYLRARLASSITSEPHGNG